jgi:hypothetical protein
VGGFHKKSSYVAKKFWYEEEDDWTILVSLFRKDIAHEMKYQQGSHTTNFKGEGSRSGG